MSSRVRRTEKKVERKMQQTSEKKQQECKKKIIIKKNNNKKKEGGKEVESTVKNSHQRDPKQHQIRIRQGFKDWHSALSFFRPV